MPRFFDPDRYNEDWYIEMKGEYQKLFDYIIETCDCAGVWRPNKFDFETKTGFKINLDSLIQKVNKGKERLSVLENGRWFLPGFIKFQWFNRKPTFELNPANHFHTGIINSLKTNKIDFLLVRGLVGVKLMAQEQAKEEEIVIGKGGAGENPKERVLIRGEVTYNAEETLLANQIEFERICMSASKSEQPAKDSLRKYHLYLAEKEQYPKGKKAVYAGFEKWLLNEHNFKKTIPDDKSQSAGRQGTSADRVQALKKW
jgi:hypothetical protein